MSEFRMQKSGDRIEKAPVEAHKRLKKAYDLAEHMEIAKIIEARKGSKMVRLEELAKRCGIKQYV